MGNPHEIINFNVSFSNKMTAFSARISLNKKITFIFHTTIKYFLHNNTFNLKNIICIHTIMDLPYEKDEFFFVGFLF